MERCSFFFQNIETIKEVVDVSISNTHTAPRILSLIVICLRFEGKLRYGTTVVVLTYANLVKIT